MKKFQLKFPYRIFLYCLMIISCVLSIASLVIEFENQIVRIVCYVVAMLLLVPGIYFLIQDVIYAKRKVEKSVVLHSSFADANSSAYRVRTFTYAVPGMLGNVIFAIFNAVMGWYGRSSWFGSMAAYYILLSVMRINAAQQERRLKGIADANERRKREILIYRRNSILFLCLAIVLAGLVAVLEISEGGKTYPGLTIYAAAAYTFYRIIMSVINMFRARKENSPLLMIVRKIGYLDACVSVLILQTAMFAAFSTSEDEMLIRWMNGFTGTVVFMMIALFGIQGIVKSKKMQEN